jgi:hypothetical protein
MWIAHKPEGRGEEGLRTSWSSEPDWRSDEEALIACAMGLEIADAMDAALRAFTRRHVLPLRDGG